MKYYYHNTIKKYILAISSILDDIHVIKTTTLSQEEKDIKVPITYGAKSKLFQYLMSYNSVLYSSAIDTGVGIVLPRIGFVDDAPQYDILRKRNNTIITTKYGDNSYEIGEPVPYNFPFYISVFTKTKDEMNQILEQLLPIFTPDVIVTVNEIPELDIKNNVSIQLDSVSYANETELGEEDEGRILVTDLNLTLHGWMYPRIKSAELIEIITIKQRQLTDPLQPTISVLESIRITPTTPTVTNNFSTISIVITNFA